MMIRIQRAAKKANTGAGCNVLSLNALSTLPASRTVAYPEIENLSPRCIFRRQQEAYFEKIKKLGSVEEKLLALNLPKYFGWPSYILNEGVIPYNFLPFSQFITRTVISENDRLPVFVSEDNLNKLKEQVKCELEKVILFENNSVRHKHELEKLYMEETKLPYYDAVTIDDMRTRRLIKQMNSAIIRVLAGEYRHLFSAQVDLDPRIEAFWRVGGFYPTEQDKKLREEKKIDESMINDPIDRFIMYYGAPILQLRSKIPLESIPRIDKSKLLPEFKEQDSNTTKEQDSKATAFLPNNDVTTKLENQNEIPPRNVSKELVDSAATGSQVACTEFNRMFPLQEYRYAPDLYLEIPRERLHGVVIPGFWPNDPYRFGIASFHSTHQCLNRPLHYGSEESDESLHSQAIIASYAWTYGQACYQGFTTYNDITYPFATQTVLTNGKEFSFYQYRLNTIVMHTDKNEADNPLYNECYATPRTELYHEVGIDGVKGWNDEALLNLLTIYTKATAPAEVDLCPYLDKNKKFISLMSEDQRRIWFHERYRGITSHRPRHYTPPEIYDWERIYKIENKIRVTDARKRFFEIFQDPINDRKLSEHPGKYVPRRHRPEKNMPHREGTYYPDVFPEYHEIV